MCASGDNQNNVRVQGYGEGQLTTIQRWQDARTRVYLLRSLPKRWASPTGLQYPPLYSKCIIITLPSGLAFIF